MNRWPILTGQWMIAIRRFPRGQVSSSIGDSGLLLIEGHAPTLSKPNAGSVMY